MGVIFRTLAGWSRHFPALAMRWGGRAAFPIAAPGADAGRYLSLAFFLSVVAAAASSLTAFATAAAPAVPAALVSFAASSAFLLSLPSVEVQRRVAEMEASMPLFLRRAGILIGMGVPFQRAVAAACEDEGALGEEFSHVLAEAERGAGLQKALGTFAASCRSAHLKRAVSQMMTAYEVGSSGTELVRLGDELLSLEQHRLRDYAAKSAVFGLLFIACTAILPVFFLVYSVAGDAAGGGGMRPDAVKVAMLVVFPLSGALVLAVSRCTVPGSAFASGGGMGTIAFAPGAAAAAAFFLFPGLEWAGVAAGMAAGAGVLCSSYRKEKNLEELECQLPDALFSLAGMPKSAGAEQVFAVVERGGHGALSDEAAKSRRQVAMNVKTDAVFHDLWARNRSALLKRACVMLRQMLAAGSLGRVGMLADDMVRILQLRRERAQTLAMQKYTLLAGGVLVPLVLRMALGLLAGIDGLAGAGGDGGSGGALAAAASVVPAYLVLYAALVSAAIADAEGKNSPAALYFIGISAGSLAVFHFINL